MDGSHYFQSQPARSDLSTGSDVRTGLVLTAVLTAITAAVLLVSGWLGDELLAPTLEAASLFLG